MSSLFETVLSQALALPDEERGKLIVRLLRSLDGRGASDDDWLAEIRRRVRALDEGAADVIDGDEVLAELHGIVDRP